MVYGFGVKYLSSILYHLIPHFNRRTNPIDRRGISGYSRNIITSVVEYEMEPMEILLHCPRAAGLF